MGSHRNGLIIQKAGSGGGMDGCDMGIVGGGNGI